MIRTYRSISILIVTALLLSHYSHSQSIVGRWEGIMADEILQVNIVQKGNMLCGYSYDFRIDNPADRCRAYFTGSYDAASGYWRLKGYRFIENSGSHVLMAINLKYFKENRKVYLRGYVLPKASLSAPQPPVDKVYIELTKEYIPEKELNSIYKVCFPDEDAPEMPVTKSKKKSPPPPIKEKQPEPEKTEVPEKKEIAKTDVQEKKNSPEKDPELPADVRNRKRNEVSKIPVSTRSIKLKVFDNGIVDDDTVSIFYNKNVLISRQKLSEKPIEIDIELDEKQVLHEIIMYAENLGSIPPNTALIVVNAGDKRYELFSSASLEENAVLVFEYSPGSR